jgi:hypothetical protein
MSFRPRTSREINLHRIEVLLKKVESLKMSKQEASKELNQRFKRLQEDNIGMYDDLYPKYIKLFKTL